MPVSVYNWSNVFKGKHIQRVNFANALKIMRIVNVDVRRKSTFFSFFFRDDYTCLYSIKERERETATPIVHVNKYFTSYGCLESCEMKCFSATHMSKRSKAVFFYVCRSCINAITDRCMLLKHV